jgi:hypothetical protein
MFGTALDCPDTEAHEDRTNSGKWFSCSWTLSLGLGAVNTAAKLATDTASIASCFTEMRQRSATYG